MSSVWARPEDLTVPEAERFCERMARREAKNFYWGFLSLPRRQRMAIYALYDFARQVDDDADIAGGSVPPSSAGGSGGAGRLPVPPSSAGGSGEPGPANLAASLERHRHRAHLCALGQASDPVTMVLAPAMERYAIPEPELQALIDGVEMDLTRTRYATWEELEGYCRLVASTVGRMCVRIFGFEDRSALERADELGIALQLTNVLRDVREDGQMGRVYLPAEDLTRFGVVEADLLAGRPGPGWEALVDFETRRARSYYATGLRVLDLIPRRPAACVATMAGIYERILRVVERDPRLPLRGRASLSPTAKLAVMARSWVRPRSSCTG